MRQERSEQPGQERIVRSAEEARQGRIVLRRRWQRTVFVAGLVGMAVLAVAVPVLLLA